MLLRTKLILATSLFAITWVAAVAFGLQLLFYYENTPGRVGTLLFSGGITASRGHAGDNMGEGAIVALVNNQTPPRIRTLVFGCSLANRGQTEVTGRCLK